jgi:phosphatidate cytidylyltransferase
MAATRSRRRDDRRRGSDLGSRIAFGVPALAFAIAIVVAGGGWFAVGVALLGIACMHELLTAYEHTGPPKLAGFVGVAGIVVAAQLGDLDTVMLAFAGFFVVLFLITLATPRATGPGVAIVVLGVAWIGLAIGHAVLLRDLPHGGGIVADVLVGTFACDIAAYFGGRTFGVTPLAPRVSPSKTWEGLGSGIVVGVLGVWLAGTYQDWLSGTDALLLGVGVAVLGPLGDLFESYLKRDAGIKDTGSMFGAHGGALDRLDAVLFTVVVGYWIWRALL